MPAKGLTPHIWEVGKIKIGGKETEKTTSSKGNEFQKSEKFDFFKIVHNEVDETNNFIENVELTELIKSKNSDIKTNESGRLLEIPVSLLYDEIDQNIPTRYAYYSGRNMACSGDGVTGNDNLLGEKKCPCDRLKNNECKLNGMLKLKISGIEYIGGCHIFRTTGFNAVNSAIGFQEYIKEQTNGVLSGINFYLILNSKIMRPSGAPSNIGYVPCLIYKGTIDELRLEAYEIVRKENEYLYACGQRLIKKNAGNNNQITFIDNNDESQFVNEFYPEQKEEKPQEKPIEQPESNDSDDMKPTFDAYKEEILSIYASLINSDRALWQVWFSDIPLYMPTDEIFNSCKSKDWNNAQYWLDKIIEHNPDKNKDEDLPQLENIEFYIGKLVGRKTWNDALGKRDVKSVKEITDFVEFIREIDDIPF